MDEPLWVASTVRESPPVVEESSIGASLAERVDLPSERDANVREDLDQYLDRNDFIQHMPQNIKETVSVNLCTEMATFCENFLKKV